MEEGVYFTGKTFGEFFAQLRNEILEQIKQEFDLPPKTSEKMEVWLKETDVCRILRVTKPTLYSLVREGKLNKYPIRKGLVRYKRSEIDNLLNGKSNG